MLRARTDTWHEYTHKDMFDVMLWRNGIGKGRHILGPRGFEPVEKIDGRPLSQIVSRDRTVS